MIARALGYALALPVWPAQLVLYPFALVGAFQVKAWSDWMADQADREGGAVNRGKGLQRHAPLKANAGLSRTSGLLRVAPPQRHAPLPRSTTPPKAPNRRERPAGADPGVLTWAEVRPIALERDGWRCIGCGAPNPDVHHRVLKGMGGSRLLDHLANALSLCGPGNTAGCHGWAHRFRNSEALARGWCVPRGQDPAWWPVLFSDGNRYLLDDHGDLTRVA